jgi:hypothetical protein
MKAFWSQFRMYLKSYAVWLLLDCWRTFRQLDMTIAVQLRDYTWIFVFTECDWWTIPNCTVALADLLMAVSIFKFSNVINTFCQINVCVHSLNLYISIICCPSHHNLQTRVSRKKDFGQRPALGEVTWFIGRTNISSKWELQAPGGLARLP